MVGERPGRRRLALKGLNVETRSNPVDAALLVLSKLRALQSSGRAKAAVDGESPCGSTVGEKKEMSPAPAAEAGLWALLVVSCVVAVVVIAAAGR